MSFRILAAVDLGEDSTVMVEYVSTLLANREGSIDLLFVSQRVSVPTMGHPAAKDLMSHFVVGEDNELAELNVLMEKLEPSQRGTCTVRRGEASAEIVDESSNGYDLVVVGTHGRTGLSAVLLGSVAERVVRHAPVPVLVVR